MSDRMKRNLIRYGITVAVCGAISGVYILTSGIQYQTLVNVYRILSDAFFIPGLLCLFAGLLMWISNEGGLDFLGYTVTHLRNIIIPSFHWQKETYAEYVERRKGKKAAGFGFLLVVGGAFLAVSVIFMMLYSQVHS